MRGAVALTSVERAFALLSRADGKIPSAWNKFPPPSETEIAEALGVIEAEGSNRQREIARNWKEAKA